MGRKRRKNPCRRKGTPAIRLLSFDVWIEIFDQLSNVATTGKLLTLRRTCKLFKSLLEPITFRKLSDQAVSTIVQVLFLCKQPRLRSHVKSLDLRWWEGENVEPETWTLETMFCRRLGDFIVQQKVLQPLALTADDLENILSQLSEGRLSAVYGIALFLCHQVQTLHIRLREYDGCFFHIFEYTAGAIIWKGLLRSRKGVSPTHSPSITNMDLWAKRENLDAWKFLLHHSNLQTMTVHTGEMIKWCSLPWNPLSGGCLRYFECNVPVCTNGIEYLLRTCLNLQKLHVYSGWDPKSALAPDKYKLSVIRIGELLRELHTPLKSLIIRVSNLSLSEPYWYTYDAPLGDLSSLTTLENLDIGEHSLFGPPGAKLSSGRLAEILPRSLRKLSLSGDTDRAPKGEGSGPRLQLMADRDSECRILQGDQRFLHLQYIQLYRGVHVPEIEPKEGWKSWALAQPTGLSYLADGCTPSDQERHAIDLYHKQVAEIEAIKIR